MNKVILMGRLTRDADVRYTQGQNQMAIAKFSLAVDRKYKKQGGGDNEPTADFFNCTAFGNTAEVIERYCGKGSKIMVEGRLQNNNYTNKEGQKVYSIEVMVESIEFCEKAGAANGGQQQPQGMPSGDEFMRIPEGIEEQLPFN